MHVTCSHTSPIVASRCAGTLGGPSAVLAALLGAETPDPAVVVGALLAGRLAEIPGARWASITQRGGPSGFVTVAVSHDFAGQVDEVQYELGDGPCLRAVEGAVVAADASALRSWWPEFACRVVADTPVRSVLSQPLGSSVTLGSLNVYSDGPDGLPQSALAAATEVAEACALALAAVQARVRADQLALALESSRRIGAAIGIVMAHSRCTQEQAFDTIRVASQRTHRKLRDLADEIIFTGAVPDQ